MNKKFPKDCPYDCPHFRTYDLSVDDWTCICNKLKMQIDECDMDFIFAFCPLDNEKGD